VADRSGSAPFDPALVEVAVDLARYFGARRQDAEDVAQEALLKLVLSGDAIENPVAWLYVVVRRQLRRRSRGMDQQASPRALTSVNPWPAVDLSLDAHRLMARLSSRARKSLLLSVAGFSERETAARLGCSVKATEKTLHKARREARRLLQNG
jgi:RNA polymerase sigma factor (sigma-70 family)